MALTSNLKAYWKMDVSSGTVPDATGNGNTLSNRNSVAFGSGKINNTAQFGSSMAHTKSLYINGTGMVGLNAATGNAYTVAFWFKPNATPTNGSGVGRVFDMGGTGFITIQYRHDGTNVVLDALTGSGTAISYVTTLTNGTWYHIMLTCGTDNVTRLYINNSQVGSNGTNGGSASGVNFAIGNANNNIGSNANGTAADIDECGVWQQQLDSTDRSRLYNGGSGLSYDNFASTDVTVNATTVTATVSTPAPSVSGGASVASSVVTATFSTPAPAISGGANVPASVVTAVFSLPAPNIITPDAQVDASVVTATFSTPAPTVQIDTVTDVGVQTITASIPSASVQIDFTHDANVQVATFSTPAPTISAESNITVTPDPITLTFSLPAPTVTGEINAMVEVGVLTATFSLPAPTITAIRNVTVDASVLTATFGVFAPRKVGGLWTAQPRVEGTWTPQARVI